MSNLNSAAFTRFSSNAIDAGIRYPDYVRECKRAFIQEVLDRNHGNQSKAARELGMHRNTLTRTIDELGMPRPHAAQRESVHPEASVA